MQTATHDTPATQREPNPDPSGRRGAGRDRWLGGGAQLLSERGPEGLKLHSLARSIGRTTGSFYHHFAGMAEFREELAANFSGQALRDAQEEAAHDDPIEELHRFLHIHERQQVDDLASAMRAWSRSFPPAARAVEEAEQKLLRYFEGLFRRLGSTRTTARAQSVLLFSLGVAGSRPPWRRSAAERRRTIEIILSGSPS